MSSNRAPRSARLANKEKGVTLPVDNRPLPGGKRQKTGATPAAAAAVADTPVAAVPQKLDFTFENAWLARVTHGLSQQEIGDMLAGALGHYARAKKAGVPFPVIPGGFDSLTMADFGGMVTALEALADFAKWSHSGDKPDLPEGYAASPSMTSAAAALGFGIQKLEILHNLQLSKIKRKKVLLTAAIFKKLDGRLQTWISSPRTCYGICYRATASG